MKKLGRILATILSITLLITSCPEVLAAGLNAEIVEVDANGQVFNETTLLDDAENDDDMSKESASDETAEQTSKEEDSDETADQTSEEEKDELLEATGEEESEETLVTAEESSILLIDKDTESSAAGQLEKDGWSWDKSTATLILKGANLTKGLKIDGVNATIDVQADSSISFEYVEGEYGYESFIVGAGTAVTVKGGHKLTLGSDKAVSKKSALAFYGSASLEICDGTKVYISDYSASNPISMNDYSVLSMTGTGTELNISSPIDTLRAAIGAYMSDAPQLKINDGATFTFTTGTTSATGTICILNNKTAKVDLRGGKVVVNNTGTCDPNTVFIFANSIRYDDDAALVNSKMLSDDSSAAWRLDGAVTGTVEAPVTYSLTGTNSPRLVAVKQPEKLTNVKSGVSTGNPTLSFELDVLNGTADGPITYTWKKDGVEVETNTSGSYTIGALETGLYKYTCTATATSGGKAVEETSDTAVVIASEAGKKISETLYFDETSESVDKLSEYGYKYDKNTGTLTLAGAVIYNQLYLAGDKAFKVVLKEGTDSYIYRINSTGGYALGFSCMNSEISGTGKLHIKCKDNYQTKGIYTGNYYGKDGYGEVSIKDGAQIDISVVDGLAVYVYYNGSINIEGQGTKVNIKKNYTISYGLPDFCVIYAETGSKFILTNKAELAVDYENKESSGAIIYGYYNVKNISVINGAKVTANVNTFLPLINSSGNVDITGGNLSLHSLAACSAAGTGVIKIYSSSTSPASFLRSDDSETETSGLATFTEKGINTNGAVTDVSISSTSGPRVKIIKNPESMYKVLRNDPNTPNLTVEAKTYEMASTQVISYQWYSCDSLGENASKIAGATSEKFKVPTMTEYKSAYYYCLVSAKYNGKTYTRKSTVAEVRGVSKLTTPRKTSLYIDSLTADSSSETEGWSYEYSTKTLTLNGFELTNGQLRLPAGVTIVLADGSINSIDNQLNDYPLYAMNGTLTIKGNGVLDITSNQASGYVVQCNYGTLNIEGNALVHIKPCEGKKLYHARIDGGSFKALAPENAYFVKNGGFYLNDEHYYGELWLSGTESTVVFPRWKELSGPVAVKQNETATLSAQAESTDPKALLTYSWRSCDENGATISVLDDQKGKNLTISDIKTLGTSYYYCRVTTTIQVGLNSYDIYINSDVMGVTVNESGRISRSKILDLKSAITDQKNRAEGWEYKAATRTLTLDNADLGPVSGYATAISLPADSTIVLADGTNNIVRGSIEAKGNLTIEGSGSLKADMTLNTYSISVSGQLIVRNNAVIDLTNNVSSYAAIYCKCLKVEQSTLRTKTKYNYQVCFNGENDLSLAAAKLDKGTYEKHNGCVRGEAIEDAYYEMSILPTEDVLFTFDKDITYRSLVTTSIGATAPVLDVHAKVYGGNEKISYQWYEVSNFEDPVNYKTAVNCKQANYTVNNSARGIKYYMCAAEATINGKKQTIYTNVCAVVTAAQGKKPVTGLLEVSDTYCKSYSCTGTFLEDYAEGKGAEYGISFTAKTSTECAKLTLTDVTICNAFSTNNSYGDGLDLVKEIDLVIPEGTKTYVYGGADGISWRNSCTISGSGTLITQGTQGARNENTLSRDGQLKVTDTSWEMGNWQYAGFESIVLDNAKVKVDGSFATSYACGNLKLINGSILRVSDRADIFGNLEIDANSAAYIHGSSATALKMADAANQTISVDGILSLSAEGKGQNRTIIFGGLTDYDASHMTNQGTSPIKLPESGITSSDYSYSSAYGGMVLTTTDELLFAPASFQKKAVGAIAKPAGTAAVNSKLTAGDLTPADATVSYQWQYASTANAADEFWEDISSQNDKTYTPSGTYENKYLRVKASGYGQYTGTVYSPVVGPVSGDPAGLSSLVIDHNSALLGGFSGSIHTYTSTVNKMKNADGSMPTMSIQAVPVSSDATVLIRNTTTAEGFNPAVINGVSGDIELYTDGEVGTITNTILVEVCYQGKITTYTVNVYVRIADASIKLYGRSTGCVIASWNDGSSDMAINTAGIAGNTVSANIKPGTEVKVTIVSANGFYLKQFSPYYGMDEYNDYLTWDDSGNRVITFTMPNTDSTVNLHAESTSCYGVKPPTMDAGWAYNSSTDSYFIRVNGDMTLTSEEYYGYVEKPAMSARLFDSAGNEVSLRNDLQYSGKYYYGFADGLWTDSGDIYGWDSTTETKLSLDPNQTYTLKLGYKYTNSTEDLSDSLQTVVLKPVKDTVKLELSKHYLVVPVPTSGLGTKTYEVPAIISGLKSSVGFGTVDVVGNVDGHLIDAYASDQKLVISVPENAVPKTYYITVKIDAGANNFVFDTLKLEVQEENSDAKAYFTTATGSLNIYENTGVELPLNIIGTAKEITGAQFIQAGLSDRDFNATLSNKYTIEVVNNRTLRIVPKNDVLLDDTYTGNYAAYAKTLAGTMKGYIKLTFEGGSELVTLTPYTLKVSATAPVVKANAVKFNSFYVNQAQSIAFTGRNITVNKAKVDTSKATAKVPASPNWVTLSDNGKTVTLENSSLTNNKGTGKINLNVWLDGYRFPVQVPVNVSAAYQIPKVSLSANKISVPADASLYLSEGAVALKLLSSDKKVAYSSLNITSLRLANAADRASLSAKDKTAYLATDDYNLYGSFNKETGAFVLYKKSGVNQLLSGKIMLIATIGEKAEQEIKLSIDVKAVANGTITATSDVKKVTINPGLGHSSDALENSVDVKQVKLVTNAAGYDVGKLAPAAGEKQLTYKVVNPKNKQEVLTSELTISQAGDNRNLLYIRTNKNATHKDYLVQFEIGGIAKTVDITVSIVTSAPKLTVSKTNITMDRTLYEKTGTVPITVSLGNSGFKFANYSLSNLNVSVYKGTALVDNSIIYSSQCGDWENATKGTVTLGLGSNAVAGRYKAVLTYTMPNGSTANPVTVNITVKETIPSWKAEKTIVTLNNKLGKQELDAAYIKMTLSAGELNGAAPEYVLKDTRGKEITNAVAYLLVTYDYGTQKLCIKPNSSCEYGATYKLELRGRVKTNTALSGQYVLTKPTTITVKIPKEDNTDKAISSKLKASGKINLSRTNSSVVITNTYTNWNQAVTNASATNKPVVIWKVYAKVGKNAYAGDYRVDDTANEGIVASSDNKAASWFVDTDSSDFGITLAANRDGLAWANGAINPALKYTLEVITVFPKYKNGTEDLTVKSSTAFTVEAGTVKASVSPAKVSLSKLNKNDSQVVVINLTDKDVNQVAQIDKVLVENPGNSQFDATLLFATNKRAYVAVSWKNNTLPSTPKNGRLNLQIYLKGNDSAKNKPNAKTSLPVNVY